MMKKQKNPVINKEQYKHYLINEVEILKQENQTLKQTIVNVLTEIEELKDELLFHKSQGEIMN